MQRVERANEIDALRCLSVPAGVDKSDLVVLVPCRGVGQRRDASGIGVDDGNRQASATLSRGSGSGPYG